MKKEILVNNELFTDYKAVARAADLVEREIIDADRIEVIPVGADKRAFAKDIKQATSYYSEHRRQERVRIEVNRESLYDMLPEGLFHSPPMGSSGMDEDAMIKDVRERREEEKQARLFFSPFDAEINHARVMTELYENKLDKKTTYTDLNRVFEFGWAGFNLLSREQSIIWMHLLPEIQEKRNDIAFVSKLLTALFNIPIELKDNTDAIKSMPIPAQLQMKLGKSALGIDTIIGDNFLPDDEQLLISIGPCPPEDLVDFMPRGGKRQIMDMVIDHLIPVETEVVLQMLTPDAYKETLLEEHSSSVYLGYTVYL